MDKITINRQLNDLKDRYPGEVALIEGIQTLYNKEVKSISDREVQALLQFPMQFTQRIPIGDGEWTTQLHKWADDQTEVLLCIDPLMLTARDSKDETVLMSLLLAAMGRFTQQINYDLIQKILNTNMNYTALELPGDENSKVEGSAWDEKDIHGATALDYIADFAMGTGLFDGTEPDETVQQMLAEFANTPKEPAEDDKEVENFDEEKAQEEVIETNEALAKSTETNPQAIETADEESGNDPVNPVVDEKTENPNPSDNPKLTPPLNADGANNESDEKTKKTAELLNALLTIGRNIF